MYIFVFSQMAQVARGVCERERERERERESERERKRKKFIKFYFRYIPHATIA